MPGTKKPGKKTDKKVKLFALSTCIWCQKTKDFLESNGIEYDCTYVDLLSGAEREAAVAEMKKHNPRGSYPTLVCGDEVIVGFDDRRIREALGI
jgi:glutaredoxin-like protein NrdH